MLKRSKILFISNEEIKKSQKKHDSEIAKNPIAKKYFDDERKIIEEIRAKKEKEKLKEEGGKQIEYF